MILIVGLGNPGREYEGTRHNMGFMTLDYLMEHKVGEEINKAGFKGLYTKAPFAGQQVLFLKPQTFMNLSGTSVQEIVNFYKINIDDIIVVYDDMDLEPGKIRLRPAGSSGGHKGMGNIIQCLGTDKIKRIRIGIGKAPHSVIDYVLEKPKGQEKDDIDIAIAKAADAIEDILEHGFVLAMNHFN
jgi:PTH1 family peptidyl-tRNA hydrolase